MATYTSTLPKELLEQLSEYAQKLDLPKNQIIEQALRSYFDRLKKAEYIRSFQRAAQDQEVLALAEEGLEDYIDMIEE